MTEVNPNIKVEYVLSENIPADWKGKAGFINKDIIADVIPTSCPACPIFPARRNWFFHSRSR